MRLLLAGEVDAGRQPHAVLDVRAGQPLPPADRCSRSCGVGSEPPPG